MFSGTISIYKRNSSADGKKTVKINCLGDSITFGVGSNTDPCDSLNLNVSYRQYHRVWEELYDVAVTNCGESGSHVAKYDVKKGYQPNLSRSFAERVSEMPKNADIVTVLGGVNDCQSGYFTPFEFGSTHDSSNTEINTFCGAVRAVVARIKKDSPDALIVWLSPLKYSDRSIGDTIPPWRFQPLLKHYTEALALLASELGIHFIDCTTPSELAFTENSSDPCVFGDRLHFGWKGHEILSRFIFDTLASRGLIKIID